MPPSSSLTPAWNPSIDDADDALARLREGRVTVTTEAHLHKRVRAHVTALSKMTNRYAKELRRADFLAEMSNTCAFDAHKLGIHPDERDENTTVHLTPDGYVLLSHETDTCVMTAPLSFRSATELAIGTLLAARSTAATYYNVGEDREADRAIWLVTLDKQAVAEATRWGLGDGVDVAEVAFC